MFNDKWRFAAGLQLDVFAPSLPTSLPFSVDGAPVGNSIKGQVRVERYLKLGSDSQLTLQGALSEPLNSIKTPDISVDEDNGLPNFEGRIAFGLGKPSRIGLLSERPVEIGLSGVVGKLRRTALPSEPARRVISDHLGSQSRVSSEPWQTASDLRVKCTPGRDSDKWLAASSNHSMP